MHRRLFWALLLLTVAVYGVMLAWSLPTVSHGAGGLAPFDMRPNGYGFAEAEAFLAALSNDRVEFYRQVQQRLDLFYPALISLTLLFALVGLVPGWISEWRWAAVLPTLPIAAFDYLENHAVASMLQGGRDALTPHLVEWASRCTVLKASFTTLSMSILLLLAKLIGSLRRRVGPRPSPRRNSVVVSRSRDLRPRRVRLTLQRFEFSMPSQLPPEQAECGDLRKPRFDRVVVAIGKLSLPRRLKCPFGARASHPHSADIGRKRSDRF